MTDIAPPQGRSMRELHAIVAADQARFDELAELWNQLLTEQQVELVAVAQRMSEENE